MSHMMSDNRGNYHCDLVNGPPHIFELELLKLVWTELALICLNGPMNIILQPVTTHFNITGMANNKAYKTYMEILSVKNKYIQYIYIYIYIKKPMTSLCCKYTPQSRKNIFSKDKNKFNSL